MNVIGYIRVSTADQARSGCSLSYQREDTEAYCPEQCKAFTRMHVKRRSFMAGCTHMMLTLNSTNIG